jgi:hypothetical protein
VDYITYVNGQYYREVPFSEYGDIRKQLREISSQEGFAGGLLSAQTYQFNAADHAKGFQTIWVSVPR